MKQLTIADILQLIEYSAKSDDPIPQDFWVELHNDAPYYKFLYFLAQATEPSLIIELGVLHGKGTAHLAAGAPKAKVIGIDLNLPVVKPPYPNIEWWKGDTLEVGQKLLFADADLLIDILFIDSLHEAAHATKEFNLYWPILKPGSILLADDIYLGDMCNFWEIVPSPKFIDSGLHNNLGFGVAIK